MKPTKPGQTVNDYARTTGLNVDWVYRQVRAGKIAHVRLYGRIFIIEPKAPRERKLERLI